MLIPKHLILIAIYLIILSNSLFSQIILQGIVTDNGAEYLGNGAEPVAGALVTVTDQADTNRTFSTYTDEQGQYSIQIIPTDVDDDPSVTSGDLRLMQNYPNPFNSSTIIGYELSKSSHISIEIYNVLGQKVRTLLDGFQNSSGQVTWNGTNDKGQGVSAGLYIYSMKADGKRVNRKMLLINSQQGSTYISAAPSARAGLTGKSILNKQMADLYVLKVTGENIASYKQQDLEITASITVDITVTRIAADIEGNVYRTVKIGNQWWMAENLRTTKYNDGTAIPLISDASAWVDPTYILISPAYCWYDNDETTYKTTYGALYKWYTLNTGKLCPTGWHVPTDAEWTTLTGYLGGESVAGGKLKEADTTDWFSPNTGATNEAGFTAIPGGRRDENGNFGRVGEYGLWWSATLRGDYGSWCRRLEYDNGAIVRTYVYKLYGLSVRCVKD